MKNITYLFYIGIFALCLISCTKESKNEKKLAGVWEATTVKIKYYQNNEFFKDSTLKNSGALFLYDDDELDNQLKYTLAIVPKGFSITWEGNKGNLVTLMGLNIDKLTKNKLELSENISDNDLNNYQTVIYSFKRP